MSDDQYRTELVRAAGFAKASVTQLVKALELYDARDEVPGPTPPPVERSGLWIGEDEIMTLPMEGAAWDIVLRDATRDPGEANIIDQDSHHDVYTMAAALVAVRTRDAERIEVAVSRISEVVGTEENTSPRPPRWLAIGRNLGAYIIAADLLRMIDAIPDDVLKWIAGWATKKIPENNPPEEDVLLSQEVFVSGSNAAAQEAFAFTALGAFLDDPAMLEFAWDRFRVFVGEIPGEINLRLGIHGNWDTPPEENWVHDVDDPVAIIPKGVTRDGRRTDGAIINDMSRATGDYRWPPGWTQYPWVNLEGSVPCAYILHRAGYPAFEAGDRALLRALEYLEYLADETGDVRWFDGERASEVVQLVNHIYETDFPVLGVAGQGRTFGYTSWTHP